MCVVAGKVKLRNEGQWKFAAKRFLGNAGLPLSMMTEEAISGLGVAQALPNISGADDAVNADLIVSDNTHCTHRIQGCHADVGLIGGKVLEFPTPRGDKII